MGVYVDSMRATYGRMKLCHMISDSTDELLAMADRIGVARKWLQNAGTAREHYDIAMSKRALAVHFGAVEITWRQAGQMCMRRRVTGELGPSDDAAAWVRNYSLERYGPLIAT